MADSHAHLYNRRRVLTIDDLPDDVLLEIFDFYVVRYQDLGFGEFINYNTRRKIESWQSLVHVCRRWRGLVFESPRRLDLQLYCRTRTRKSLDVWPVLPLVIIGSVNVISADDVIAEAVLEHSGSIRYIDLDLHTTIPFEKIWTAMQVPFPELARLRLSFGSSSYGPVLPNSFLGGSAPRLRYLYLHSIPLFGLPKLLLSATHLVQLWLLNIPPHFGYILPGAMATCLSMLPCLETLRLEFDHPHFYPDPNSRRLFLSTRSVLPALMKISFQGLNEYLEEIVARIDAPRLYRLSTAFFSDIDFDTPELKQFISRTPTLGAYNETCLTFDYEEACVRLRQSHAEPSGHRMVRVTILGEVSDRPLSILAKICTLPLRLPLTIENLYIDTSSLLLLDIENIDSEWLDLLLPFTAVKNLYLSELISPLIAHALQELAGGKTTEVLPALQNVLLEGFEPSEPIQEGIAQFISARQLTISVWGRDYSEEFDDW